MPERFERGQELLDDTDQRWRVIGVSGRTAELLLVADGLRARVVHRTLLLSLDSPRIGMWVMVKPAPVQKPVGAGR